MSDKHGSDQDGGGFGIAFDLDMPDPPKKAPPPPPAPSNPGGGSAPKMQSVEMAEDYVEVVRPDGLYDANRPDPNKHLHQMPFGEAVDIPPPAPSRPIITKEQIDQVKVAAAKVGAQAAEGAKVVAEKTRDVAMHAAVRSIGGHAEKSIRLEDPRTWWRPMLLPIVLFGLAIFVSILASVITSITGSKLSLTWLSGLLFLAAIVFGVIRWIRLQKEE